MVDVVAVPDHPAAPARTPPPLPLTETQDVSAGDAAHSLPLDALPPLRPPRGTRSTLTLPAPPRAPGRAVAVPALPAEPTGGQQRVAGGAGLEHAGRIAPKFPGRNEHRRIDPHPPLPQSSRRVRRFGLPPPPRAIADSVLTERYPCAGCPHRRQCAQGLACEAFQLYCREKPQDPTAWQRAPRVPSREAYLAVFNEVEEEPAPAPRSAPRRTLHLPGSALTA